MLASLPTTNKNQQESSLSKADKNSSPKTRYFITSFEKQINFSKEFQDFEKEIQQVNPRLATKYKLFDSVSFLLFFFYFEMKKTKFFFFVGYGIIWYERSKLIIIKFFH